MFMYLFYIAARLSMGSVQHRINELLTKLPVNDPNFAKKKKKKRNYITILWEFGGTEYLIYSMIRVTFFCLFHWDNLFFARPFSSLPTA